MQGDVFQDIPLSQLLLSRSGEDEMAGAILLTPTCDFALKGDHPERQLAPIESLHGLDSDSSGARMPHHVLRMPPFPGVLPFGGLLHFRRVVTLHKDLLTHDQRRGTLDAGGVRTLLAAHTTYYTRSALDPDDISLMPDDPRLLWEAIDASRTLAGLAAQRRALEAASALAIRALLYHHGLRTESVGQSLVLLEQCSDHGVFPRTTIEAATMLSRSQQILKDLYSVPPAELPGRRTDLDRLRAHLEKVALVLQQPHPLQVTPTVIREHGMSNILPR